jgi:outer membrane protein
MLKPGLRRAILLITIVLVSQNRQFMRRFIQPAFGKPAFIFILIVLSTLSTHAQSRIGYISMSELIQAMPEFKKVDSTLNNYQLALSQRYQEMVNEVNEKDSVLSSPDTLHMTREQLDVSRRGLKELYNRVQGFSQSVNQLLQQRQDELLAPIRKKANDLIWQLAKEHGYTYVLLKETIAVYPLGDDLLPYARQRLGLR